MATRKAICSRCHQPSRWLIQPISAISYNFLNFGLIYPTNTRAYSLLLQIVAIRCLCSRGSRANAGGPQAELERRIETGLESPAEAIRRGGGQKSLPRQMSLHGELTFM